MQANAEYIWFDGKFVPFSDAKVHVLTHSLQYGSGFFEGIRAYKTDKGAAIFRLDDHVDRFFKSAKIYGINPGYTQKQIHDAIVDTVRKNKLQECYIRPFGFYRTTKLGVTPVDAAISIIVAAIPFGNYFANKNNGIKCRVSSWQRIHTTILPPEAKGSGNYLNSVIASLEAKKEGADEAILLSINGDVAEGPGENIFFVQKGRLVTPSKDSDILLGITRDSIMKIAEAKGLEVEERKIHREEMYTSDEAFFSGTAAEITPIIEIDSKKIGDGKIGPITKMLMEAYDEVVLGKNEEFSDWLTFVG
ncbi:MAG: branched-chain amino acid transaminase [Candidatus Micrarchaeota archaeon]|nr:branched-chain amino acid transaminase [Candidatus Micrarchaeota archaeon]